MSPTCGCQAKLGGGELKTTLQLALGRGHVHPEDCAVIFNPSSHSLVTTDFGPLVGPKPFQGGRIAGFHAMSDVFAMGGTPHSALAIVTTNRDHAAEVATSALAGLGAACAEEGVQIVGGHTTVGDELVIGLTIIGTPGETTLAKGGVRVGDVLMLSKPLGTGMMVRAYVLGRLDLDELEPALATMDTSNRGASIAAVHAGASALTDVTGFGLLGHTAEMVAENELGATIELDAVPVLAGVRSLPDVFARSAFIDQNLDYASSLTRVKGIRDRVALGPLLDPQTSGGLLASVAAGAVPAMQQAGFTRVGQVTDNPGLEII